MARKKRKKKKFANRPDIITRLLYLAGRMGLIIVFVFLGVVTRLLYLIGRLCRWMISVTLRGSRKNPLLAFGFALFVVTFSFVSYNAFFRQPAVHRSVFFSTRSIHDHAGMSAWQNGFSGGQDVSNSAGDMGHRQAVPEQDIELKTMQKKLAALGLYSGEIDGLSGPRTREAIRSWQQLQKNLVHDGQTVSVEMTDSIGVVIRNRTGMADLSAAKGSMEIEAALSPTKETIMRVQDALRLFGNSDIVVNGMVDHITEKAVRAFQSRFVLPVTGKIDRALIDKMREIGILG